MGMRRMHVLLDGALPRDQARLLEQAGGLGSCLMGITPNRNLNSVIPTDTYRLALRWWLGCPLLEYDAQHPPLCPGCQSTVDPHGDHLLCCRRINFTSRHQAMQEALASVLTDAGQPFEREVQVPGCPDGQLRRAAGQGGKTPPSTSPLYTDGRPLFGQLPSAGSDGGRFWSRKNSRRW